MARVKPNLVTGIDVGTANVKALVGEVHEDGGIDIIGYGCQPSRVFLGCFPAAGTSSQ